MWTRKEVKGYAKDFLKKNYWKAFIVCLIATLLSGGGGINRNTNTINDNQNNSYYDNYYGLVDDFQEKLPFDLGGPIIFSVSRNFSSPLLMIGGGLFLIMLIVVVILAITVGFAIEVGKSRFFIKGLKGDTSIRNLVSTFNSEEYFPIVISMFLRNLYIFLWTFLLIIPGIVKYYEYRFVPYILAEKNNLSPNEVIKKSREITSGHKMGMFILDLSFLGWYFLGALLFGVGVFLVDPYVEATYAKLYSVLFNNDLKSAL